MVAPIAFTCERHIGLITLQRPQALNALSLEMIIALQQQLLLWQEDPSIQAVVIRSEGGKAFCAGGDVRWLYEAGLAKSPEQMQFFWHEYRLNHYLQEFTKPYIALMDGITMGGGVGISLHGSHPVATEHFVFAMPETGIGLFPDIGSSYLLSRCPGQLGLYLALTGNRLTALDARNVGFVNHVIGAEQLDAVVDALIHAKLTTSDAHHQVSACLQQFTASAMEQKTALGEQEQEDINACFSEESVEKIIAALQKRKTKWTLSLVDNLKQKAPLSLKITLAQYQKAKSLSMADCIKMDYCLVKHFMHDHDFYEGVRALLIDKDKNPRWHPESLETVTEAQVASYFECRQTELPLLGDNF